MPSRSGRCPMRRPCAGPRVKVTVDPFVGRMGLFRVHQGTITRTSALYIGDGRKPFKVGHLLAAARQGLRRGAERSAGRHRGGCKGPTRFTSTQCWHGAAEDDHIHLQRPLPFPCRARLAMNPSAEVTSTDVGNLQAG